MSIKYTKKLEIFCYVQTSSKFLVFLFPCWDLIKCLNTSMLTTALSEIVQQFYHPTEIGSDVPESFFSSQSRVRVMSPSTQSLQKFFESSQSRLVCKLESMSSQMKFHVFPMIFFCCEMASNILSNCAWSVKKWCPTYYEMAPDKLENGAQYCLASLISGYLYLSFCKSTLHFTCLFHSRSFPQVLPNLAATFATSRLALCWMCNSPQTWRASTTTPIYMWREQAIIEWAQQVISIIAFCHSVKPCALVARAFQMQQSDALTSMGAIRLGTRGTRPPAFSASGDIIYAMSPHILVFGFCNILV